MMTPEPRLSERRSRVPKTSSWSPKKYRKKGSAEKGEFDVFVTCNDEIFATPLTACPATRVKSGPTATIAGEGPAVGTGRACPSAAGGGEGVGGRATTSSAFESAVMWRRDVSSRPPMKPAVI